MSRAKLGQGTKLLISDGEPIPTFFEVAELTSIGQSGVEADSIDCTSHSNFEGWRQFLQGLKDTGRVEIEGNFVTNEDDFFTNKEEQSIVDQLFNAGEIRLMKLAWPMGNNKFFVQEFEGFVSERRSPSAAYDDLIDFSAQIKIAQTRLEKTYNSETAADIDSTFNGDQKVSKNKSAAFLMELLFGVRGDEVLKDSYTAFEHQLY